jgi:hypothetical protein
MPDREDGRDRPRCVENRVVSRWDERASARDTLHISPCHFPPAAARPTSWRLKVAIDRFKIEAEGRAGAGSPSRERGGADVG